MVSAIRNLARRFFHWLVKFRNPDSCIGDDDPRPDGMRELHRRGRYFIVLDSPWWLVCEDNPGDDRNPFLVNRYQFSDLAIREVNRRYALQCRERSEAT